MQYKTASKHMAFLVLSIFLTGAPAFAFSQHEAISQSSYRRIERVYVISAHKPVLALCDANDQVVTASCAGAEILASENGHGIYLAKELADESGRKGVSCAAKILHPTQILRIESVVTCSKMNAKS